MHLIIKILLIGAIFSWVFIAYPAIDLVFTNFFYNKSAGFYLKDHFIVILLDDIAGNLGYVLAGILIALLVITLLKGRSVLFSKLQMAFLLLVLVIGPGLVVHEVFKNNFGRARPHQTVYFGGQAEFTPPWIISDNCKTNCSFVSGHAAIGFYLAAFALVATRYSTLTFWGSFMIGSLFGMGRIIQGKHFLSDIIFSAIIVLLITHIIYMIMKKFTDGEPNE